MRAPLTLMTVRPMRPDHLGEVARLQRLAYQDQALVEPIEVHASRLRCWPSCCFVAQDEACGLIVGYLVAHPWPRSSSPGLGYIMDQTHHINLDPLDGDALHIHDLVVDRPARGQRVAEQLVMSALEAGIALNLTCSTLVAVEGAHTFWARHGFVIERDAPEYGHDARLMCRPL